MLGHKNPRRQPRRSSTTGVTLLLDMSGSMLRHQDETIQQVNRYLDSLKHDGQGYKLTVVTFNERTNSLVVRKDIRDVGHLEHVEYYPEGWTRLLDAVGSSLSNHLHEDDRNLFVVITDGQENDSRNYGLQEVRRLIDAKRSENFQFVFLGNGPESWQTGQRMGFNFSVATDWTDPRNTENIYKSLYTASNSMSAGNGIKIQMFNTNSTTAKQSQ